ncbi:DedA family protein [soil metagenome]|jgi:membrane protein DedA with SNARE-associated domain
MLEFLTHIVEQYGYFAVALLVTIEGFGVPLPGETAVVVAAAFAARGSLNIVGVVISTTIGTILGGSGGYWIGRVGGRSLLERYGHLLRMDEKRLARTEAYFDRHGAKTVFFARFVALLRIFGSLMAGVAHMPFPTFTAVNAFGGLLWAVTFSAVGYLFGKNLSRLDGYLGEVGIALSVLVVLGYLVYRWRESHKSSAE